MADNSKNAIVQKFLGMDTDSILERVEDNWFIDGENFRIYAGQDGNAGALRELGGTLEVLWDVPASGTNTGLGCFWDERGNTLIVFVHNSDNLHSILWVHMDEVRARTMTSAEFNLTLGNTITGVAFVNVDLLLFVDGMDGDKPKCFNLPRADSYNKKSIVRVYIPQVDGLVDTRSFTGAVTLDGVQQGIAFVLGTATSEEVWRFTPLSGLFVSWWNAIPALRSKFLAVGCADYVELEAQQAGMWSVESTVIDTINGTPLPQQQLIVEYWNRYNDPLSRYQIRLAMVKPTLPPFVISLLDSETPSSQVSGKTWQFAYGYRFKDKQRSLVGPISSIVIPSSNTCGAAAPPNSVLISFSSDRWLNTPATRGEVEFIDIYAREGNNGSWILAKSMAKYEWMYSREWTFRNDIAAPSADQAFVEMSTTSVPDTANALEIFVDSDDNTRAAMGGIKEGHPTPCVDVMAWVDVEGDVLSPAAKGAIVGNIKIINFDPSTPFNFIMSQPIWKLETDGKIIYGGLSNNTHSTDQEAIGQWFGKGAEGWVVYAEGTDYAAMSSQNAFSVSGQSPDLVAGTNAYDGTSQTRRDKIRDGINQPPIGGNVFSRFLLTGLDAGRTYVIRMADPRCGFFETGDAESGTRFDLNSIGRLYQGTSPNAYLFGTNLGNPNVITGTFEIIVTIPAAGGTIDVGEILVADACRPGVSTNNWVHKIYLRDDDGNDYTATNDIRTTGYSAELQEIEYDLFPLPVPGTIYPAEWEYMRRMIYDGKVWTDHNGHAFFFSTMNLPNARWVSAGGVIPNDYANNRWEGTLDTSVPLTPAPNPLDDSNQLSEYFFPNLDPDAQGRIRTHVVTFLTDQAGTPLQGVLAILEDGGSAVSDSAGRVRIPAYVDTSTNLNNRQGLLILATGSACSMTFPNDKLPVDIQQYVLNGTYSEFVDYVIASQQVLVFGQAPIMCFSRGGVYPYGFYVEQPDGSRSPVKWLGDMRIPHVGQDLHDINPFLYPVGTFSRGAGVIKWLISGGVPIPWSGRWEKLQFVVGDDGTRMFQLEWLAGQVVYSSGWDETGSKPTDVGFSSGNATEVYISLTDSLQRYKDVHVDSMLGYLWEQGDMIRILSDRFGTPLQSVVEIRLGGQRDVVGGQVGRWIIIPYTSAIPQLYGGEVIEIYRPSQSSLGTGRQVFYDIPGAEVLVVNPESDNPTWATTSGTVRNGDTYLLPSLVPNRLSDTSLWVSKRVVRESKSASDFYPSESWSKGRPWFMNADAETEKRGVLIRFTDAYKPGTSINGLNLCGAFSYKIVENWLGPIRVMRRIQDVIFCVCENGAFSIYVGIQQQQTTPAALLETVGGILGNVRPFAHKHGTRHPQSVVRGATTIVYYDETNGAYVQYNSNELGDRAAQERMHAYFTKKSAALPEGANVCGGWDMPNGMFMCSFPIVSETEYGDDGLPVERKIPAETIMYHDDANKFISKLIYYPDCWGTTRQRLWSFKDGRLLLHDAPGAVPNLIDGVQLQVSVTPAFVGSETMLKQPTVLWLGRGGGWEVSKVTASDEGQLSNIPEEFFETLRGKVSKAAFFADTNTPSYGLTLPTLSNGDQLVATAFAVELRFVGPRKCRLLNATMFFLDMTPTN